MMVVMMMMMMMFFKNLGLYNVEKYCRARKATDDNRTHVYCMLDIKGYKHTLRIYNNLCFSISTVVARTRLSVTLYVLCLSCFWTYMVNSAFTAAQKSLYSAINLDRPFFHKDRAIKVWFHPSECTPLQRLYGGTHLHVLAARSDFTNLGLPLANVHAVYVGKHLVSYRTTLPRGSDKPGSKKQK